MWIAVALFYGLISLWVFAAVTGRDMVTYQRLREQSPKMFRSLVINARMAMVFSLCVLPLLGVMLFKALIDPSEADRSGHITIAQVIAILPLAPVLYILIIRAGLWAWRVKLP